MAATSYGVNHPLAVKTWARRLFYEVTKESYVGKFLGNTSNSLIQTKGELSKGPGDRIRIGLRMLLNGRGTTGDNTLEGNEEQLVTHNMDVLIDQLRHAVRSGGKMSEQRVPFSVRDEAMQALKDWWMERLEVGFANQITGNSAQTDLAYTGLNAAIAPDAAHAIFANGETAEASVSNGANWHFSLTLLDRAVTRAKTLSPKIRPIRINGADHYVAFLHPNQVFQMRTNTNNGQWLDIEKAAFAARSGANTSPIFDGSLGMYNNIILHEWSYLPTFASANATVNNNLYRAVLCGAQSAVMANGQDNSATEMSWREEMFDYGNELGVSAGMIFGMRKTTFNNADFGTITMSSFSPAP